MKKINIEEFKALKEKLYILRDYINNEIKDTNIEYKISYFYNAKKVPALLKIKYKDKLLMIEDILNNKEIFEEIPIESHLKDTPIVNLLKFKYKPGEIKQFIYEHSEIINFIIKNEDDFVKYYLPNNNIEKDIKLTIKKIYNNLTLSSSKNETKIKELENIFSKENMNIIDNISTNKQFNKYNELTINKNIDQQEFIELLGIENLKIFANDNEKFLKHFLNEDIPFKIINEYIKKIKPEIETDKNVLSYEEFELIIFNVIEEMRMDSLFKTYENYDWIDGEFREEFYNIFIDDVSSEELKTAFYKNDFNLELLEKYEKYLPLLIERYLSLNEIIEIKGNLYKVFLGKKFPEVTKIKTQIQCLRNKELLKSFPNLKEVEITSYGILKREDIKFIKENTNIELILCKEHDIIEENMELEENEIGVFSPVNLYDFNGLKVIKNTPPQSTYFKMIMNSENIDISKIFELLNSYTYSNNIEDLYIGNINKLNNYEVFMPILKYHKNKSMIEYRINENLDEITKIYDYLKDKLNIENITIECDNKEYNNLYILNKLDKEINFNIKYPGAYSESSLEEFKSMRETIKWFNSLIKENDLSPVEIIMYAFDIMKTFEYKENKEDKKLSRNIHSVTSTEYIVCVGYAKLLKQILDENEIKSTIIDAEPDYDSKEGHVRNLIKIDDYKYDIHGVYSVDSTWDSATNIYLTKTKDNTEKITTKLELTDKVIKEYSSTALYDFFLIPTKEYQTVFPYEKLPLLIETEINNTYEKLLLPSYFTEYTTSILNDEIVDLFGTNPDINVIKKYMKAKKPSLEIFKKIYSNVKLAQGYEKNQINKMIEEVIDLNQIIDNFLNDKKTFFKSSQKK